MYVVADVGLGAVPVMFPLVAKLKLIVVAGVPLVPVKTLPPLVTSVIETVELEEADTDKDTVEPAETVPREPALVEKVGACDAVIIALVDLAAPPSLFSILMKYVPAAKLVVAFIEVELVNATAVALVIAPVSDFINSTI